MAILSGVFLGATILTLHGELAGGSLNPYLSCGFTAHANACWFSDV